MLMNLKIVINQLQKTKLLNLIQEEENSTGITTMDEIRKLPENNRITLVD